MKQYIITKEWVEELLSYSVSDARKREIAQEIRAREVPEEPDPCADNGCTDIENCDEICQNTRLYSPLQMQEAKKAARAAGAKEERERVLSKLSGFYIEYRASADKHNDTNLVRFIDGLLIRIESLRSQEERK